MLIRNLFRYWTFQVFSPGTVLREKYESFKALLEHDKAAHEFMAALEDIYYTPEKCDFQAVIKIYNNFSAEVLHMVEELLKMNPSNYWSLKAYYKKFDFYIRFMLAPPEFDFSPPFTIVLDDIALVNESFAGKKAFALSLLNKELDLPAPDGFVITTSAFHFFMEANNLRSPVNKILAGLDISNPSSMDRAACKIQQLISAAIVPEDIVIAITNAISNLEKTHGNNLKVAVRSSAVKEDGKASFAGQYQTLLNVDKQDIIKGYKQVIAGKYSARALFYRISHGLLDDETPMAVLVLEMIDSKASGVIYTRDMAENNIDNLLIHSIWGQGELLVDGKISPDVIKISRKKPYTVIDIKTGLKQKQMVLEPEIHTRILDTSAEQRNMPSLDMSSALTLARWGILLEDHFKTPQDIEWCQDKTGKLFILQSRSLNYNFGKNLKKFRQTQVENHAAINKIICSKGETICPGTGSGTVFRLDQLSQIPDIPDGTVLVVRQAMPQLITAINRLTAIVIGAGSRASHFSSIAREFGIPAIVNPVKGFDDIVQGSQVTVDADQSIVYEGIDSVLMKKSVSRKDFFADSSFMTKLRYVINFCTKLKLTDPEAVDFMPEACRSLHDIIRFTHETAMQEMFLIGDRKGSRKKGARKLISRIPMLFYILDVGYGIRNDLENETFLKPEEITSIPMKAVLKGLSNPGICWSETTHFDWEEYDRIVMSGGIISADSPRFGSYAVLSKEYLNVNFRFGYHFVILDTICSFEPKDNYILFRFSGGGGSPAGRSLRAHFIQGILKRLGFMVKIKSDLIDAEFRHGSLKTMKRILDMTGRLLGATKLMDMYLKKNFDIETMIDDFMNGRYDFRTAVDQGAMEREKK